LDFGESPEDGAVREAWEETGLRVTLGELCEVQSELFSFSDRDMHSIRFIYRVVRWEGDLRDELDGSTDRCAFIPFEALSEGYEHPEFGPLSMVPLAVRGLELARQMA
jgi:ADP-ribose pyrophosphatase YjhB (NUDIX family)